MFRYGQSNFTWNGTLKELEGTHPYKGAEGRRFTMTSTSSSSSGLEVLLSTLKDAGDVESTINILNVLDELLSAGTDRRIHYMISKGGSEALLTALVKSSFSPNYTLLLPLLHLLAKVGHRDRRIGIKAQDAGAVLLTLNLLKHNVSHARRAAAFLWVLQVFCSSVSTANLLGQNHGLDVIYRLIPHYTTKNLPTVKASINAFAALLCTKANVCSAVYKGYICGLLRLYENWHSEDIHHVAIAIRSAILRCLHQATHSTAGRKAFLSQGGLGLLYETTQTCLMQQNCQSLVDPAVQLMRKCLPRTRLMLPSDHSAYTFPLPDRPYPIIPDRTVAAGDSCDDDDDDEEEEEEEEDPEDDKENRGYDDDLETDVDLLRHRPDPDRPTELLLQYRRLCPELTHDFQDLNWNTDVERNTTVSSPSSSSDGDSVSCNSSPLPRRRRDGSMSSSETDREPHPSAAAQLEACGFHIHTSPRFRTRSREPRGDVPLGPNMDEDDDDEEDAEESRHRTLIDILLERSGTQVPHHEPKLYRDAASRTKSIPGFSILAFPDFWGHLSPPEPEPMAPRKPHVQRQKVFEDVQRFLHNDDIINQVVFDLEDNSGRCVSHTNESLRFFSKFECGNLRKAVQVRRYEYDLILNADANTSHHTQWFYFEVSNMVADVPYRFNVINCEKSNSQFNYGMQPVLYSVKEALEGRPHWHRSGAEICYFRNHFCPVQGPKAATFYTLTFTITFKHQDDVCYLAYHYPYTYSGLKAHLKVLQNSVDSTKVFFRQQVLCGSLAENTCPLITITACPASRSWRDLHQLRNRPYIVLTGRVHPGESNASWVMKGTLEFLCSADLVAQSLREAFIFKIIPMLNPDGVINGMNRCDLNHEDLNRQWTRPDPVFSPTIYHTKGFLYYLNSIHRTPLVFCDYHGHSRKKNVFLYGCSVKETVWQSGSAVDTTGLKEDPGYRTIPKTLDRIAPAFAINSCNYLVEKSRSATARVVVWREMGVVRSYTMESTYNGCDQGIYKDLQTGTRELQEVGLKFCHSLLSVTKNLRTFYNHVHLDHNAMDHTSDSCFEDDEPPCVENIEYSTDGSALSHSDLDSDVNTNIPSTDEDHQDEDDDHQKGSVSQSQQPSLKTCLFPQLSQQTARDAMSDRQRSCKGGSTANGHI